MVQQRGATPPARTAMGGCKEREAEIRGPLCREAQGDTNPDEPHPCSTPSSAEPRATARLPASGSVLHSACAFSYCKVPPPPC